MKLQTIVGSCRCSPAAPEARRGRKLGRALRQAHPESLDHHQLPGPLVSGKIFSFSVSSSVKWGEKDLAEPR